jgi:hypothetical protein
LFEQRPQLHFAPAAARFHIGQHPLQATDIACQLLHRPETLVYLFQSLAHELERFAQAFFECSLQFFVYRGAHSFDLLRIVFLQFLQAQIDDPTHAFQRGGQFFALRFGRVGIFLAVPRQFIAKHLFFSFLRTLKQLDST